jgi:hypothetical protein
MPGRFAMKSAKPLRRSLAGDEPVVPCNSMMRALPLTALSSHSAARLPWSTKSEPMKVT